MSEPLQIVDT